MKTYTWSRSSLKVGLSLTDDEHLGLVVFLGENGRGRRYEKVALDRRNPPFKFGQPTPEGGISNPRVEEASVRKIVLPAQGGKPEKAFFVLEQSRQDGWEVLIRVNTYSAYIRGGNGNWTTVEGEPETVISGYGAFGDAGRVGTWDDGLVRMKPGDVIKVHPSRSIDGVSSFALWVDEDGTPQTATWREYENLKAVAQVEALVAETEAGQKGLELAFGMMSAFTYVGRGQFQPGIEVKTGVTGPCVILGEEGRGRMKTEVAIVGFVPGERLESAAVAKLLEETVPGRYSYDPSTTKVIWGLISSEQAEPGAVLVRVNPGLGKRVSRTTKPLRGNPTLLGRGVVAGGAAGYCESSDDGLWVLRSGESLTVGTYDNPGWVVENADGNIRVEATETWEARDAAADPAPYLAKGRAAWSQVPAEWVGRVVSVHVFCQENGRMWLNQTHEGELVSTGNGRLELNLGWDGRDRKVVTVDSGLWVHLETCKTVTPPKPERETAKAEVTRFQGEAQAVRDEGHFKCLESGLQGRVVKVADGKSESSWSEDPVDFVAASTEEIGRWTKWAETVMIEVRETSPAAKELHRRQTGGEVLANFETWKRRGGATNCGQGWVVRPDGSLREPDRMDCPRPRHQHEGTQHWDLVAEIELAISWSKAYTAAPHEFTVAKRPVSGLTQAQLATVEQLEREIAEQWDGAVGMSGHTSSPPVGRGWGLKPLPAPKPAAPAGPPVKLGGLDLAGLFGGAVVVKNDKRRH